MPPPPAARSGRRHPRLVAGLSILAGVMFVALVLASPRSFGLDLGLGGPVTVVYKLTGSASGAGVVTYTDGAGNIQQATNVTVPLRRTGGGEGITIRAQRGDYVAFSAQNAGPSGDLICAIEANGVVINTGRAQGGFAIVMCSATVP